MTPSLSLSDLPPPLAAEFDRRCEAYMRSWPESQKLETVLEGMDGPHYRALLRHALRMEFDLLQGAGQMPDARNYFGRFGADDVVSAVLGEAITMPVAPGIAPAQLPCVPGFEVLRLLGRGGMGEVYLARSLKLRNRQVALKLVREHWADADAAERARCEAEAVARLNDKNVVTIYEVGEHEGQPYLSLEYVPGGSLAERLTGGPMPPAQAVRLVETLARTLHVIHACRLVHRDLKPANVLLTEDGSPKVTDFGVAKHLDAGQGRTASGAIIGTAEYMAPEQARGDSARADCRTDVYALGAILYECLTGRPPFRAASLHATLVQICSEEPVSPRLLNKDIDRGLAFICLKCLEKDPVHRYQSAEELADDLRRWLSGESPVQMSLLEWLWRTLTRRGQIDDARMWARIAALDGVWSLLGHTALALLLAAGVGTMGCWAWYLAFHAIAWLFVWPILQRRQRFDPFERGLIFNWLAAIASDTVLFAFFCPPWGSAAPSEIVRVYPVWLTVHGLMWVMEARQYWGRFYALGFAYLLVAPLLPLFGQWAPVAFGTINGGGLLWLADGLRRLEAEQAKDRPIP